ncbi:tetratricopeptide repeat protein 39C-like isoform X2 [Cylas formicarius]|uniref:tetratricopeptide repeat protein 39C-like isoform X2 n=1 Tax=Cylas formicarius TaxID=197179 RepID=UPI00295871DC|nr:tetratricopeptide repeat protein 39C-like isoform X2 [Cylas formicarius]
MTTSSKSDEPHWLLARKGINLLLNNNHAEAEALFLKYPDSLTMFAGYSFATFMDALMSFEDDKLNKALRTLNELERRCSNRNGWLKTFSHRVFGTENSQSVIDQLEGQTIQADSQGGWALRKAWKVYQKTYKELIKLHRERIGELQLPEPAPTPSSPTVPGEQPSPEMLNGYSPSFHKPSLSHSQSQTFAKNADSRRNQSKRPSTLSLKKSTSINHPLSTEQDSGPFRLGAFTISAFAKPLNQLFEGKRSPVDDLQIDDDTIVRLLRAVSFGYGLFQLGISLLPPTLVKLVSFFGFSASRDNGVACLTYARLGADMRAPLASLSLLWYHTIVRPFYAIDGTNIQTGVDISSEVLRESREEFASSSLFLFFRGRVCRLNSDITEALKCFKRANERATQREIKILAMHEVGWCHLIRLDYRNAEEVFLYLRCASRWSRGFYAYLAVICLGASDDHDRYGHFDQLKSCILGSRGAQLDVFLRRRLACCPRDAQSARKLKGVYWKLLVFEMLYLWNAMASCGARGIDQILEDCNSVEGPEDEPMKGLTNFVRGMCFCIGKSEEEAAACFRKCLDERKHEEMSAEDAHISAFAQFELGYLLVQKERTKDEGKSLLQQVSRYSNYDFEARLTVRIHSTLRYL